MKMWKYLAYALLGIIVLILLYKKKIREDEDVLGNAAFSIGVLTSYTPKGVNIYVPGKLSHMGKSAWIKFQYRIPSGEIVESTYPSAPGLSHIPSEGLEDEVGSHFLVLYNKNNPREVRMLLDCPITDTNMTEEEVARLGREFLESYKKEETTDR